MKSVSHSDRDEMPVTHYISDYRGVVAGAPCLDVLRVLKMELDRCSNQQLYPQLRMFLRGGYATQPGRFHRECTELEQTYDDSTIKGTLSCLARAAARCSEIVIFTAAPLQSNNS